MNYNNTQPVKKTKPMPVRGSRTKKNKDNSKKSK